uniref:Putative ovule protein n=1 Tax=Solanum chacoense TaxID=4108 RepID=A0A0V0HXZ9_SOLCH
MKALRVILILFEAISGHHINWRRSKLFPVNEVTGLQQLADILSGEMGCFPTVYLKDVKKTGKVEISVLISRRKAGYD